MVTRMDIALCGRKSNNQNNQKKYTYLSSYWFYVLKGLQGIPFQKEDVAFPTQIRTSYYDVDPYAYSAVPPTPPGNVSDSG